MTSSWNDYFRQVAEQRFRVAIHLSGDHQWCYQTALAILEEAAISQSIWLADHMPANAITPAKGRADQWLGRESQALVIDAFSGFDPDAVGALAGTVISQGLAIFLTPEENQWNKLADPCSLRLLSWPAETAQVPSNYLQRLDSIFQSAPLCQFQQKDAAKLEAFLQALPKQRQQKATAEVIATADQQAAITAIKDLFQLKQGCLMLTADRGRGKSSALGMAAAESIRQQKQILVTAPRLLATTEIFKFAQIEPSAADLNFIAPDELLQSRPDADLLIVDEAAAIPLPMLLQMLEHWPRVVFSSTTHGYEGSGRGFSLKFSSLAKKAGKNWQQLEIRQPIRWGENDPLEQFISQLLLLDAEPQSIDLFDKKQHQSLSVAKVTPDQLINQPQLLSDIYGLLVQAHYQTKPSDLRILLDNPDGHLWAAFSRQQLVAVVFALEEGGFPADLAQQIWLGQRRPRGHLLAQSMAAHGGIPDAPCQKGLRISRIAVLPQLQGTGIGSQLLQQIAKQATAFDWLGTSFGASEALVDFWLNNDFIPIRLGISKDAASGQHSLQMLKPISKRANNLCQRLNFQLNRQLDELIQHNHLQVSAQLKQKIANNPISDNQLTDHDWYNLIAFSIGHRNFELSRSSLALFLSWCQKESLLDAQELDQLLSKLEPPISQRKHWLKQLRLQFTTLVKQVLPRVHQALWNQHCSDSDRISIKA